MNEALVIKLEYYASKLNKRIPLKSFSLRKKKRKKKVFFSIKPKHEFSV